MIDSGEFAPLVAKLETICFDTLRNGDTAESTKLFNACCRDGIFYLDMLGTEPGILQAVEDIYVLEENIFSVAEEELMQYDIDKLSPRKLNGFAAPEASKTWTTTEQQRLDISLLVGIMASS